MPKISFNSGHEELTLPEGAALSEHLTVQNSPVLFGCRTGICGTCLVLIDGDLPPPDEQEREILEVYAAGKAKARLACQVRIATDLSIRRASPGAKP